MSGRAARYLRVLQELGHLDDDALVAVLFDAAGDPLREEPIAVESVRKAAARRLFLRDGGRVTGPTATDWPVLFS